METYACLGATRQVWEHVVREVREEERLPQWPPSERRKVSVGASLGWRRMQEPHVLSDGEDGGMDRAVWPII